MRLTSFGASLALHGAAIAWMFFGPSLDSPARTRAKVEARNLYEQEIAPHEKRLVWYNFRDKLPEVSPLARHGISRPPKTAGGATKQTIVSKPPKAPKAPQMVWLPAPDVKLERELESPNLLAFAVPKLPPPERSQPKAFAPPEAERRAAPAPALPDAPQVAAAGPKPDLPGPDALPRPRAKEFVPPESRREPAASSSLPDAPKLSATVQPPALALGDAPKLKPRDFVPPPEVKRLPGPAPSLPDAPNVAATATPPALALGEAPKLKPRDFVPPPEVKRSPGPAPSLPDAPNVASVAKLFDMPRTAPPKLKPRDFVPPREAQRAPGPTPSLPDAPRLAAVGKPLDMPRPEPPKLKARDFVPPEAKRSPGLAPSLPDAPTVAAGARQPLYFPGTPKPSKLKPRDFTPPVETTRSPGRATSLPEAPQVAAAVQQPELPRAASLAKPAPRTFVPPRQTTAAADGTASLPDAPPAEAPLASSALVGNLTAAIVGLKPNGNLPPPIPEGSRPADFSSGPEKRKDGGTGEPVESARIFVPDLMVRDGRLNPAPVLVKALAPTSEENLRAAIRSSPLLPSELEARGATVVASAPDPRFEGRIIYNVAIQMPNVTSYIGSWIMWFAEREPLPGHPPEMTAPVPLHKVDPKYHPSAVAERVEGKVQLGAVILRDGHVDAVTVIKRLDDRLDFAAQQALKQWEFSPALRNGQAVAVDAVFEIPFRLAPLSAPLSTPLIRR